ncbi:MAG: thioredoxin fold domain-containing protein [Betaproteobacteria bacterium]|nr:thioredoxin fold domain-containing protein [Betaproteobacteria bacterium]
MLRVLLAALIFSVAICCAAPARAQVASPHAIEIPAWFAETFLDLREDVRDAAKDGKRLMVYFGQDGCPYCTSLMQTSFRQPGIVDKTRRQFVAVALNIWGDREVTWMDGKAMREKEFARFLKVQFTPTLVFFDGKGNIVARLNGYYPPHRLEPALDYVAGRMETKLTLAEHMKSAVREAASETLHDEPFFVPVPRDLRRKTGSKPLAVLFETNFCSGCDEMHREGFKRPEVLEQIAKFDVVRLHVGDAVELTTPGGRKMRADAWARELKVTYTPTIVFFDPRGREAFRVEAYVRPFHLAGSFAYVASGAYAKEPSFQRFLQARTERQRERGMSVDLWK